MIFEGAIKEAYAEYCRLKACSGKKRNLSVVWWNTSMNPYGRKKLSAKACAVTCKSILDIIKDNDIVVLGEYVDEHGLRGSLEEINLDNELSGSKKCYDIVDLHFVESVKSKGRMINFEFHNLIVYDVSRLSYVRETTEAMTCNKLDQKRYRVYQRVKFVNLALGLRGLELVIVHWSMRDTHDKDAEDRRKRIAARKIKDMLIAEEAEYPFQLVLGDFNCEFYEEPFREMTGSRSRAYAEREKTLYNPFWKFMADDTGTIRSRGNENFQCDVPVFDCIMVSHGIVEKSSGLEIESTVLSEVKPFSANNHRPVRVNLVK